MSNIFKLIKNNQFIAIKKLVKTNKKAVELRDDIGNTPLICAARNNNLALVKFLLSKNANINKKNLLGINPLVLAAKNKNVEMYLLLLKKERIPKNYSLAKENLLKYAFHGNLNKIKNIFHKNPKFDLKKGYINNITPLMAAAMNNQSKTIEYLLEKGADLNQRSKGGDTVLHAGVFGSHAIVKKLINKGVSVNQLNKSGISPVKLAIYLKKTAIIKLLLKHSANPNFHGKAPTAAVIKKISSSHIKN